MSLPRALLPALLVALAGCNEPFRHLDDAAPRPGSTPEKIAARIAKGTTDTISTRPGDFSVIPLEHATLLFEWQGRAIYVDPTSPTIDDGSLPPADVVLVTDAHYDHLDPFALAQVSKPGTIVVASPAAAERAKLDAIHEGETRVLPPGFSVTAVPAYGVERGAGQGMLYHPRGRAVGYVLDLGDARIYVSGDTECTPELKGLADIDLAFVSLNVPYAMTAQEATACVAAFRPKIVIPYAYRHAVPATLDRAALGSGIEVRRRELYPRAAEMRQGAYWAFVHGMWGLAHDRLDNAKRLDPAGDADWRVQWTREWLRDYENPWPW